MLLQFKYQCAYTGISDLYHVHVHAAFTNIYIPKPWIYTCCIVTNHHGHIQVYQIYHVHVHAASTKYTQHTDHASVQTAMCIYRYIGSLLCTCTWCIHQHLYTFIYQNHEYTHVASGQTTMCINRYIWSLQCTCTCCILQHWYT